MARLFAAASSQYLSFAGDVVDTTPITMACWFRKSALGTTQGLMTIGADATNDQWQFRVTSTDFVQANAIDAGTGSTANTTTTITANTWHHGCAVFAGSSSRAAYIDGGSKGTNTTLRTPDISDTVVIGAQWATGVASGFWDGDIAEAAMWNVALTDAEVALLAKGVSPMTVRPELLSGYWPLMGRTSPEIGVVGGFGMTLNAGPVQSSHPPKVGWFPYRIGGIKKITPVSGLARLALLGVGV